MSEVQAILTALLNIAPQLFALVQQELSGTAVTAAQVQAVFTQYGVDEATTAALIVAAKAAGK